MAACAQDWQLLRDWHREMPRLADHLLKTVIYLYPTPQHALEGTGPGGSGFIVGQPTTTHGAVFLWAVTNMHVAKAKAGYSVIRTSGPSGESVIDRGPDDWITVPGGDDIAITPLGFDFSNLLDAKLSYVPRDWFVEADDFSQPRPKPLPDGSRQAVEPQGYPFGPGDETVMLGRFLGYQGHQRNEPVARFGNLSVGEPVPIRNDTYKFDQMSFLVEARSLSGYSGSPVFIYRASTTFFGNPLQVTVPRLLGIDWGHLTVGPNKAVEYTVTWGAPNRPDPVRYNSGIMTVVPAWQLAALLDSEEAVTVQRHEEERSARAGAHVELDAPESTTEDYDRFKRLAQRLVAVPKNEVDEQE